MNGGALAWLLAAAAVVAGWFAYGWPGVVLAITVVVFWLLLQFSRALRVLRMAGANPVGVVPNAVMFNAWLKPGMRLTEVLVHTRSLGRKLGEEGSHERWAWQDGSGDTVELTLVNGRLARWELKRAAA